MGLTWVNPELASIFEKKIRLCEFVGGSATRAATRHQYKLNTFKYNLNITMKLSIKNDLSIAAYDGDDVAEDRIY